MSSGLSIIWAPALPWAVIAALAVAAALVVALAMLRGAKGALLRAAFLTVLLLALANPSLVNEVRQPLEDIALVVVDESASQGVGQRPEQTAEAVAHIEQRLESLGETQVRVVRSGQGAAGQLEDGTRLFATLERELANVPRGQVSGVIVVSDGRIHDAPDSLAALGIDAPLHLLRSGEAAEGDRRLVLDSVPSYGIVGRQLTMTLKVEDLPGDGGAPRLARLTLRRDGGPAEELMVPVGEEQEVSFELDRRGPSVLELEVEAGPQELSLLNNRAAVVVNGVRERLRVLLVSGEPHAGERAWRSLLKSDPSVDLVHFTILRPPEKQDGTPIRELSLIAFPTRELFSVKLDEFDLIVFDRYRRRGVLPRIYLDNIAQYVEGGGALLEAVGPTFSTPLSLFRTPLGRILPGVPTGQNIEQGFTPQVTDVGLRHPVTADLPGAGDMAAGEDPSWGRWFRQIEVTPQRGVVAMSGVGDRPLLILDRFGEGRVGQLMSDHIWLWARGFEGGGPQAELMRRTAHWLMKEPDLEEEDLRASITDGRLQIERRSLSPEAVSVEITAPSGEISELLLQPRDDGRATAAAPAGELGLYRVTDGQHTALAASGAV
ncbi:MAG: hypothetical protein QNI94_13540, partial [Kiloniellales bacterium]|nr:hypothetical protein [Kiloniellales bacterium]